MNNSKDRAWRLDVAGAQPATPGPPNLAGGPGRRRARATPVKPWSNVVNDCAHNDKIRRDVLIALGLMLIAVVAIVFAVTGVLDPLIRDAAGNSVVRIVAGSLLGGGGFAYGGLRLHRRGVRRTELDGRPDDPDAR